MIDRRTVLLAGLAVATGARARSCGPQTHAQTAGPFFKTDSPRRASLIEPDANSRLVLAGVVLSPQCKPVANAKLDFWQADERGHYDNHGHRYRGHQFTDAEGRYRLETVVPAAYVGRTRHIHVKVQPPRPGARTLTTQLYFPGYKLNKLDPLFDEELLLALSRKDGFEEGRFDFMVDV